MTVTGRGWAYIGALLGGAVSIAANVAHSYVPPDGLTAAQAERWAPPAGAVGGAVFWPVALFVVAKDPDITPATVAAKLGDISERTARRHLSDLKRQADAAPRNGRVPELAGDAP
jgi:hypothetical protein